jgi:hypothetical protein
MSLRKDADGETGTSFWRRKPGPIFGGVVLALGLLLMVLVQVFDLRALSLGSVLVGVGGVILLRGLIVKRKG